MVLEALLKVRLGSAGHLGGTHWVWRHSWRFGWGQKALLEVREGLGGLPSGSGGLVGVIRPSQRSRWGLEGLLEVRAGMRGHS